MTTTQQTERELFEESASDRYIRELEEKHGYDHPLAIAARLEQNISQYGGENCTSLFMYEAMGALRKGVKQIEALEATIAQQGEAYLSDDDRCALISFSEQCNDSDADGFSIPKESLVRLVEIGCIRHCGFGKYETTRFGDYIVQKVFLQNPQLPLKTISEWNAEHALNHERTLAALISQKVEG